MLRAWLHKPYPLLESKLYKTAMVIGFGLFTSLFLILYQPFGAAEIQEGRALFLMGFGLCVSVGLSITYFLFPAIFTSLFVRESWQIKKEIIFLVVSFSIISIFNYLYNVNVGGSFAPQHSLFEFAGITLAVGVFPLIIMVFLVELYLNKKNNETAAELTLQMPQQFVEETQAILTIVPETQREASLELVKSTFLFATSDNNYSTIYYSREKRSNESSCDFPSKT